MSSGGSNLSELVAKQRKVQAMETCCWQTLPLLDVAAVLMADVIVVYGQH